MQYDIKAVLIKNPFRWNRPATWFYALIALVTGAPNHAALILTIDYKRYVVEAKAKGVILTPFLEWENLEKYYHKRKLFFLNIPKFSSNSYYVHQTLEYCGKPYSLWIYFTWPIYRLFRTWLGKERNDTAIHCHELIGLVFDLPNSNRLTGKELMKYHDKDMIPVL